MRGEDEEITEDTYQRSFKQQELTLADSVCVFPRGVGLSAKWVECPVLRIRLPTVPLRTTLT